MCESTHGENIGIAQPFAVALLAEYQQAFDGRILAGGTQGAGRGHEAIDAVIPRDARIDQVDFHMFEFLGDVGEHADHCLEPLHERSFMARGISIGRVIFGHGSFDIARVDGVREEIIALTQDFFCCINCQCHGLHHRYYLLMFSRKT